MVRTIGRWMLPIVALFLVGPVATLALASLRSHEGSLDVSLLVGAAPALGLLLGVVLIAGAAVYGILCSKTVDPRTGTLSAGFLLAWAAWRTGNLEHLLRLEPGPGTLIALAVEGLVVCSCAAAAALLIAGAAHSGHQPSHADLPGPHLGSAKALFRPPVLGGIAAGAAAALVVAHLVAFNGLRGQALMAGVLGALAAGAVTRLVVRASSDGETPSAAPYAAVTLAAILGPVIGFILPGGSRLASAALDGVLPGPLLVQPLDWAAGILIGTPMGLAWAGAAMSKARESKPAQAR